MDYVDFSIGLVIGWLIGSLCGRLAKWNDKRGIEELIADMKQGEVLSIIKSEFEDDCSPFGSWAKFRIDGEN